jgi:hypothetical protein
MRSKSRLAGIIAVVMAFSLFAVACGDDDAETTEAPATTGAAETTMAPETTEAAETTMAPETTEAASEEPVIVCELAYYTGEFAPYGESLTADVLFPIETVINNDPPLGRPWQLISEDIGTVGEGQAARTCLEQHGAEILVSMAHGYRTYRDWLLEWEAENDGPLGPSVHGGTIPGNLGGTAEEPIFRAQGLDEALGFGGVLTAQDFDATNVVIFATQVEGFQLAADSAQQAAEAVGIDVLARIDVPAEQPSYRPEAERIADLAPDAVIIQAGSVESATLINEFAEAGGSTHWIGESGWAQPEFSGGLADGVIDTQLSIGYAGIGYNGDTPAWDFYEPLYLAWDGQPEGQEDPAGIYHYTTYDLMIQTALAVAYGGSYKASDWAPAMFEVGDPPGTVCYTYPDCMAEIRAGNDIDYEGITGSGHYTSGGVNDQAQAYRQLNPDGTWGEPQDYDPVRVGNLTELAAVEAECDANNVCTW